MFKPGDLVVVTQRWMFSVFAGFTSTGYIRDGWQDSRAGDVLMVVYSSQMPDGDGWTFVFLFPRKNAYVCEMLTDRQNVLEPA